MAKKIKIFKIDVANQKSMFIDVEPNKVFEQLNYNYYDTPSRNVGDRMYSIICDDNGIIHNEAVCAFTYGASNKIVEHIRGSILIVKATEESFVTLDEHDKNNIFANLYCYTDVDVVRPIIRLNLGY